MQKLKKKSNKTVIKPKLCNKKDDVNINKNIYKKNEPGTKSTVFNQFTKQLLNL